MQTMKMKLFEAPLRLVEIDYRFRRHIELLVPILAELDLAKLSDKSGLEFDSRRVFIDIIPVHYDFAGLNIYIDKSQITIGFAEAEQYENHHDNSMTDLNLKAITGYLDGIIVKEHTNKNGRAIKRIYYYIDKTKIGTVALFPFFAFKTTEKEILIVFKKPKRSNQSF